MPGRMFVRPPKGGVAVPDPFGGGLVGPEGKWVENHVYWTRRIMDHSLMRVPDSEAPDPESIAPPAELLNPEDAAPRTKSRKSVAVPAPTPEGPDVYDAAKTGE